MTDKRKDTFSVKKRLYALLICLPFYPLYIIGEWYESQTAFGRRPSFSFRGHSLEYWCEVATVLVNNRDLTSWGSKQNTKIVMTKRHRYFYKQVKKETLSELTIQIIRQLTDQIKGSTLEFYIEEQVPSGSNPDPVDIELRIHRYGGWSDNDRYFGLLVTGGEILAYYYNDNAWLKNKSLSADSDLNELVTAKERFVTRPVTLEEAKDILNRLNDRNQFDWRA